MNNQKIESKEIILNLIPSAKEGAITLSDIASYTGFSYREIKAVISELRKSYPICSKETKGGGYWIAESEQDVVDFIQMIERRKAGYQATIDTMKTHLTDDTFYKMQVDEIDHRAVGK